MKEEPIDDRAEQSDEIADLRRRLAEAEATLDALRAGEVDAIVISGEAGEQVFTLKGEVHRFSEFIEKVTEGAVLLGSDGLILYANTPFARLIGKASDTLQGESLLNLIEPDQRYRLRLLLQQPDRSLMDAEFNLKTEHHRAIPVQLFSFADPADPQEVCLIVYDLTRQKRYEAQLREAGEYTRGLIESSIDAMVVIDRDLRITDANERFAALTAVPKAALIGSRFDGYFIDSAQAATAVKQVLSDGYVTNRDLALRTASGKELLVSFNASLFSLAGQAAGIFGVARDVTDQRAIERTLREEREYSRSVMRSSPDALLVSDASLVITDVNERAIQLTGYSGAELIGSKFPTLFTDPEAVARTIMQASEGPRIGDPASMEFLLLSKTASRIPVSLRTSALKDEDGKRRRIVVGIHDIGDHQRYEKQRSLLASIVDSSGDAIYSVSPDLKITSWNAAAQRLFAYTAAEIVGQSAALLVPLELRAEFFQNLTAVRQTGMSRHLETRRLRKDGMAIDVFITHSPIFDSSGKLAALSVTAHDITERIRIENELLQSRDAGLVAAHARSRFFANVSNELRTPLSSITAMAERLLATELNGAQRQFAQGVRESGNLLRSLIDDELLEFSKLAAGTVVPEEIDYELTGAVQTVIESMADQARRKQLELTIAIAPEVPRFLRGDPGGLRQVLLKLVSNAVKFTAQGEVAIAVSKLSENAREAVLRFQVRDTGIGIPNDDLQLLSEPFSPVDASTPRRPGGTGLGLVIARELVERMDGTLAVSSEPGGGTTFWFTARLSKQVEVAAGGNNENLSQPAAAEAFKEVLLGVGCSALSAVNPMPAPAPADGIIARSPALCEPPREKPAEHRSSITNAAPIAAPLAQAGAAAINDSSVPVGPRTAVRSRRGPPGPSQADK